MYFDMELIYFDVRDTEQISLKIIGVLHYAVGYYNSYCKIHYASI